MRLDEGLVLLLLKKVNVSLEGVVAVSTETESEYANTWPQSNRARTQYIRPTILPGR
jgi:hypothetical protein